MKSTNLLNEFEIVLKSIFEDNSCDCVKLYESMYYSLNAGGKRFRPNLMFSSAKMLNVDPYKLFDLAVAIELIHTYSLIHDDLPCLDNDDLRRGKATNHIIYGEDVALLAGDALQSIAFEYVYKAIEKGCDPLVLKYFAMCCRKMVEGQSLDVDENYKTSIEKIENIHCLKTGALIEFCVVAPLFFKSEYLLFDDLLTIGRNLGLAFQIKDDILDVSSSKEELGKSNSDAENNKSTYVSLIGLEQSKVLLEEKISNIKAILSKIDCNISEMEEILDLSLNRTK